MLIPWFRFRDKNVIFWLKIPAWLASDTPGDEPTSCQIYLTFVAKIMAGNVLVSSVVQMLNHNGPWSKLSSGFSDKWTAVTGVTAFLPVSPSPPLNKWRDHDACRAYKTCEFERICDVQKRFILHGETNTTVHNTEVRIHQMSCHEITVLKYILDQKSKL